MILPELHPDELLLREASSALTPSEQADLSAHLERCPACALERSLRREAARVRVPSDLDHVIAARVVGRLFEGQERELRPAKRGGAWGRRLAYAAIALVLVSGTAMAGAALVVQIRQRAAARAETDSRPAPPVEPPSKQHRGMVAPAERPETDERGSSVVPAADLAIEGRAARSERATAPGEWVSPTSAVPAWRAAGGSRPVAVNHHHSSLSPRAPVARSGPGESLPADAATLLGQAEEAGSAGRFADASRLYDALARTFPGTREEIVARALHGQLLLDRMGSPSRALGLFEAYLNAAPAGTLAEEARLGRARSLQRLGRSSEERSAWRDFLSAHPRSVHAAAAHARLAALDAP